MRKYSTKHRKREQQVVYTVVGLAMVILTPKNTQTRANNKNGILIVLAIVFNFMSDKLRT
ncbi:hypothetical protein [Isorropodon fossajaponicum symbiont]|uniref:hypothetical protein n=1 Tax=Isorropodon fossajaponicum symbiont TaxID=883811 RepID=UPI001CECAE20|nr:hypothetical protein [Isorropodon fossajaponicum symbiont]